MRNNKQKAVLFKRHAKPDTALEYCEYLRQVDLSDELISERTGLSVNRLKQFKTNYCVPNKNEQKQIERIMRCDN
ncbi:hypothetical protein [Streptococcus hyovaginalis]|uniref:hypothetical protein n=1 Tax=Streptococcus hyovaginalis TaxID=149015 RepID=UPI003B3A1D11